MRRLIARTVIDLGNDAFAQGASQELARILRELADRIERRPNPDSPIGLLDVNGNTVGQFTVRSELIPPEGIS